MSMYDKVAILANTTGINYYLEQNTQDGSVNLNIKTQHGSKLIVNACAEHVMESIIDSFIDKANSECKRLNVNIPKILHSKFCDVAASKGVTVTQLTIELMSKEVHEYIFPQVH